MVQNTLFMIKLAWTSKEKKVIVLCVLAALSTFLGNLVNLYISPAILSVLERQASLKELLWTILIFVIGMMFLSAAGSYINANEMYGRVSVRRELITLLNKKAATTSYPNLFDDNYQKLNAKAQEAVNSNRAATEAVWTTLTNLMADILCFVFYAFLLASVQPVLMLIILLTTVVSYLVSSYVNEWGYRHRDEEAVYEKQMLYFCNCERDVTAAKDIRIFGLYSWIEELHKKVMDAYLAFQRKAQGVYLWAKLADIVLTFLRNAIVYAYLIGLVLVNDLEVSRFLLYFSAVGGFAVLVSGTLTDFKELHKQSLDISTVRECIEYEEPFRFEGGQPIGEADRKGEICLENVSFRYPGSERETLKNINLVLHPGEKLAVVGLNGAGKTTLIKLFCGFLDPTGGRVLLNGKDIRNFNRAEYYSLFSAVFQNFSVLAGTIATNVAQDSVDIDDKRVKECIEKAGLRDKVESLKDTYEMYLNREIFEEAVLLSGGETQRLMLARALYKDAPFIILDEPTAALDSIAESKMYQKYNEMTRGKSSVYISHRLASTRFCDRIILLADGRMAEEGTHEELLKRGGKYAELYEVQRKYYREKGDAQDENGKEDVLGKNTETES